MSQQVLSRSRTFKEGADLSAKQFYIVKLDSSGHVILSALATDAFIGVLENAPKSGVTTDEVSVVLRSAQGTSKVIAGGTITAGAWITSDTAGKAVVTTTNKDQLLGMALVAAATGDIFEFMPCLGTLSAT